MAVGLASVSNELVPWFFGDGFEGVSYLMIILTPILFFIAISNVLGTQYLLPSNRTKEFTTSVTVGAIINLLLNIVLIPKYKALGACISTVVSEFGVTFVQYIFLRKNIKKKNYIINLVKYIIAATMMFIIVRVIGNNMGAGMVTNIIQAFIGAIVYSISLTVLKEEMNLVAIGIIKSNVNKLKNKFVRVTI